MFLVTGFAELGLDTALLKGVEAAGYSAPSPIQEQAIPVVLKGGDVLGLAQTGTGKTAAFGLPLIQKLTALDTDLSERQVRSLILAPTRELVLQIAEALKSYAQGSDLRILSVVGGASINVQIKFLLKGTDILVATPGRLMDLYEREALFLDGVDTLILDEADQMLDLGFIHVLRHLTKILTAPRQTLLFSATMPAPIARLSRDFQNDPVRIEVAPAGRTADKITQWVHYIGTQNRVDFLKNCLAEHMDGVSVVFARTKRGTEKLKNVLVDEGFAAESVHGNKSQAQRDKAIRDFKSGKANILVATDVAARGIDISGVSHVYNYDLPDVPEIYVHRIGRTARAGAEGEAISFCRPVDLHLLAEIEKLLGKRLPVASGERPTAEEIRKYGAKPVKKTSGKSGRGTSNAKVQAVNDGSSSRSGPLSAKTKTATLQVENWNPLESEKPTKKRRPKKSANEVEQGTAFVERSAPAKKGKQAKKASAKRSASRRKAAAKRALRRT
ncbi:DEAD/DEAH box helicase [Cohaesibacter gelatinilyticus]|uniref:ATP-dependent RNA helicase RhlE n=1 Tax=Cohaesibacter gelatinilyticus TaxID=372072 RepID=A0A285NHC1_9HYPH|nr:ATP-dependent RNA helicase RhlE [Cohaesibacter gelatinilyticus]